MLEKLAEIARAIRMDRWPLVGPSIRKAGRAVRYVRFGQTGLTAIIDGGHKITLSPSAFSGGAYSFDPTLTRELRTLAASGKHFIDAGAHIGIASLLYASMVDADTRVISFEPNPEAFTVLTQNAQVNRWRIEPYRLALGDRVEPVAFYADGSNTNASLSAEAPGRYWYWESHSEAPKLTRTTVTMTTLDLICDAIDVKPGVIKLDVEGAELSVLRGATRVIEKYRPTILMETHVFAWPSFGYDQNDLARAISDLSYKVLDTWGNPITRPLGEGPERDNNHFLLVPR